MPRSGRFVPQHQNRPKVQIIWTPPKIKASQNLRFRNNRISQLCHATRLAIFRRVTGDEILQFPLAFPRLSAYS
jgi:hypothetical protein